MGRKIVENAHNIKHEFRQEITNEPKVKCWFRNFCGTIESSEDQWGHGRDSQIYVWPVKILINSHKFVRFVHELKMGQKSPEAVRNIKHGFSQERRVNQ